jgi:hypothetical protein
MLQHILRTDLASLLILMLHYGLPEVVRDVESLTTFTFALQRGMYSYGYGWPILLFFAWRLLAKIIDAGDYVSVVGVVVDGFHDDIEALLGPILRDSDWRLCGRWDHGELVVESEPW